MHTYLRSHRGWTQTTTTMKPARRRSISPPRRTMWTWPRCLSRCAPRPSWMSREALPSHCDLSCLWLVLRLTATFHACGWSCVSLRPFMLVAGPASHPLRLGRRAHGLSQPRRAHSHPPRGRARHVSRAQGPAGPWCVTGPARPRGPDCNLPLRHAWLQRALRRAAAQGVCWSARRAEGEHSVCHGPKRRSVHFSILTGVQDNAQINVCDANGWTELHQVTARCVKAVFFF
jgi:hypothetical protein